MYKILVLGNGFDRACNLPTGYTDFLNFLKYINPRKKESEIIDIDERIGALIEEKSYSELEPYKEMIPHNIWIQHFFCIENRLPENRKWMDFEAEMSRVIKTLDACKKKQLSENPMFDENEAIAELPPKLDNYPWTYFFAEENLKSDIEHFLYEIYIEHKEKTFEELRDIRYRQGIRPGSMDRLYDLKWQSYNDIKEALLSDLKDLIVLLDYYLNEYVSKLEIKSTEVPFKLIEVLNWFMKGGVGIHRMILTFNYTNTFDIIMQACGYDIPKIDEICHIHGELGKENMVIGIDDNEQSEDIFWSQFEKYYQKIHNEVDGSFYDFVRSYAYSEGNHEVKIIGHSFAITDKHPLKKLLNMPESEIECFYYKDSSEIIKNATAIIGKDAMLEKALGKSGTIRFVKLS